MTVLWFGDRPTATFVQLALQKTADLASEDESEAKRVELMKKWIERICDKDSVINKTNKTDKFPGFSNFLLSRKIKIEITPHFLQKQMILSNRRGLIWQKILMKSLLQQLTVHNCYIRLLRTKRLIADFFAMKMFKKVCFSER